MIGQLLRAVRLGAEIDPDRSGREAEHRDADDEKCEVIPGCDGDDPGFDDLQHQGCCGDQAEACIERQSLRNLLHLSSPCRGGSIAALAIQSAGRSRPDSSAGDPTQKNFPTNRERCQLGSKAVWLRLLMQAQGAKYPLTVSFRKAGERRRSLQARRQSASRSNR